MSPIKYISHIYGAGCFSLKHLTSRNHRINEVTFITALFDIQRDEKGDGRNINQYLEWFKRTLKLNTPMIVYVESKFEDFVKQNRPLEYKTKIIIQRMEDLSYFKYKEHILRIINSKEYKAKIRHPDRIECILPEYDIIQYSKFGWLEEAVRINPFETDYFFWIDAGISRFFEDVNISDSYPGDKGIKIIKTNKFIVQARNDLYSYAINDNFIWDSANLLIGTMFGGYKDIVLKIGNKINNLFENIMLKENNVNNEQLALALIWRDNKDLFDIFMNKTDKHLPLFKYLSK
ncbi:hypothetical protein JXL19_12930 [bacterium]|nr:hypothetical protein [bacterium]